MLALFRQGNALGAFLPALEADDLKQVGAGILI